MAVDVFSKNFMGSMINSPTTFSSFSTSLENQTTNPIKNGYNTPCRLDHSLVDSNSAFDFDFDFAFNVDTTIQFHSSSADELFSDGKILPTSVRKEVVVKKVKREELVRPCLDPERTMGIESTKKSLKEFLEDSSEEEEPNTAVAKPFWKFRRSNSLNSESRNQKKGVIGSWKILSRSGSTGKFLEKILEEEEVVEEKSDKNPKNPKLFWKFSRSNSLSSDQNIHNNVANVAGNKGVNPSVKALRRSNSTTDQYYVSKPEPKPFRRSNSTGSAPVQVRNKKQQHLNIKNQQQEQQIGHQKGQGKSGKRHSFSGYYSSQSVKISPVLLNLPSPYISRVSVDLFGIGSLFCNGTTKDRKKKK